MNLLIVVMSLSLSHLVMGKRRLKSFGTSRLTFLFTLFKLTFSALPAKETVKQFLEAKKSFFLNLRRAS